MTRRHALFLMAAAHASPETLFDGSGLQRFRTPTRLTGPEVSWRIRDGILETIPDARRQCDLWTADEYEDFDLEFDWSIRRSRNGQ